MVISRDERQRLNVMANDNEDVASWDDICLNPHESHMELGRQEGRAAALQAGFMDGYCLGRTKGIEFGMELGFIRGFLNTVESTLLPQFESTHDARGDRIRKGVDGLRKAIDDFPNPDCMFAGLAMNDSSDAGDSEAEHGATDIMGSLLRIRGAFKVLTVQLKISRFSLKQVMADAAHQTKEDHPDSSLADGMSANDEKTSNYANGLSSEW